MALAFAAAMLPSGFLEGCIKVLISVGNFFLGLAMDNLKLFQPSPIKDYFADQSGPADGSATIGTETIPTKGAASSIHSFNILLT